MSARRAWVGAACSLAILAGCGASGDPGFDAAMRVRDAQFVPGPMPTASGGPGTVTFALGAYTIPAGLSDVPILASFEAPTTGIVIGLDGDLGYWTLPAGVPDTETPSLPTLTRTLEFSRSLVAGARELRLAAVDAVGQVGTFATAPLTIVGDTLPQGRLVISLGWDQPVDLDLHVVDPTGAEVWSNKPSAYLAPPPPAPPDSEAAKRAGSLDLDSNASCRIDGRNRENVVYRDPPPAGHYLVRVDTFSLCDRVTTAWSVTVRVDGEEVRRADGVSIPSDTFGTHERGAGKTALEFDLP